MYFGMSVFLLGWDGRKENNKAMLEKQGNEALCMTDS